MVVAFKGLMNNKHYLPPELRVGVCLKKTYLIYLLNNDMFFQASQLTVLSVDNWIYSWLLGEKLEIQHAKWIGCAVWNEGRVEGGLWFIGGMFMWASIKAMLMLVA